MDRQQLEELQRRAEASLKNNKVYQITSFLYFPGFVLIFVLRQLSNYNQRKKTNKVRNEKAT